MISKSIIIKGKVHGVFFRASAKRVAESLDLKGWVKNTNSGNVEIIVTGEQSNVEEFINWCRIGPEKAVVQEIIINESNEIHLSNFKIIN